MMKTLKEILDKMDEWQDMANEFFVLSAKAPTDRMEAEMIRAEKVARAWVEALDWVIKSEPLVKVAKK